MAILAFKNGLRLHEDSILLFHSGAYPSALLLSVLSLEELGKSMALEEYVWRARTESRAKPDLEKQFIDRLYSHKYKQLSFAALIDLPVH